MTLRLASGLAAAALVAGLPAAPRPAGGPYRIVLSSDRDGTKRGYTVLPDGSSLTPLLAAGRRLAPAVVSADGTTVAYASSGDALYVSRADGTGLRRVVARDAEAAGFSPDGRFLAFTRGIGIWIVRSDGGGVRRLTRGDFDVSPAWSPNSNAIAFARDFDEGNDRFSLIVQPLRGRRRVLVRTGHAAINGGRGVDEPTWSPDGRWIAYTNDEDDVRKHGLWLAQPNGKRLHRVARGAVGQPAWSADGRWLAYVRYGSDDYPHDLWIVRLDGHDARHVVHAADSVSSFAWSPASATLAVLADTTATIAPLDGSPRTLEVGLRLASGLTWSPDGRLLAFAGGGQIWAFASDGRGFHRVTREGSNEAIGWTRLPPVLPPAPPVPPTERVVDATTVATRSRVTLLAADGTHVAFVAKPTPSDCDHVAVWTPGDPTIARLAAPPAPCSFGTHIYELAFAGSRAAWAEIDTDGPPCATNLETATLAAPTIRLADDPGAPCRAVDDLYHLGGDGELLVFGFWSRLLRIGGTESCGGTLVDARVCTRIARGPRPLPVESVGRGLIALGDAGTIVVVDDHGQLVRRFTFSPADVEAARLDGGRLVAWRFGGLESYDVASGVRQLTRSLPPGFRLADVDGGVAVLLGADAVELLRLDDGRSVMLTAGPSALADLEPPGLYYSYRTADGGRIVFVPRAEVERRLAGSAR